MSELLRSLIAPYLDWPVLSSLIGGAATLLVVMLASIGLYRLLQSVAKRLSPGPVFLFGALFVAVVYAVLLVYARASGRSFEAAAIEWLTEVTDLPLDTLGVEGRAMLLSFFFFAMQAIYLVVVVAAAWAIGLFSSPREESVAAEIEGELGTSLAMRFYRLAGYHRPEAPELRFHGYGKELVKVLGWCKWLSLPAAITGAIPVALWVVGAIVHDGMKRNLTPPPDEPEEKKKDEEAKALAAPPGRDARLLVSVLQNDERGPQLRLLGGGTLEGGAEHAAERTRVKDESGILADVLDALGIEGFYVHQEAAAEAILAGKDVLMETSPLSGRRTLCDVLAMRAVLLDGGTVLYLSPTPGESARRAKAFRDVAQRSNWRWAIFHRDLADNGREGLDLRLRQPQIVFTTPAELHADLCRLHRDWDYFMQSLALVVAIDLDRYSGALGANLTFLMRRLARVADSARAAPRVLATVAPFGPDVQGFAERVLGRPLEVIGPESDSRGAPTQYVVVGAPREPGALHAAVSSRGVAIACGYNAEIWGHGAVLTDFEQEQQVNKVLLSFNKAVVSPGEGGDLRFDHAHAVVARLSSEKAAMLPFFTRHTGRTALGVHAFRAQEIGKRKEQDGTPAIPFAGFARHEEEVALGVKEKAPGGEVEAEAEDVAPGAEELAAMLAAQPELCFAIWLADNDAFARLLGQNPAWVHPRLVHTMLRLGSRLVAAADNASVTMRHLVCAAGETPITRAEAGREFSAAALDALVAGTAETSERLVQRPRLRLTADGAVVHDEELVLDGELSYRGVAEVATVAVVEVKNRAGGELVGRVDRARALAAMYPGRVLVSGGRRYRVLLPEEQDRLEEGLVWVEPERRRIVTARIREVELRAEGEGHALALGGSATVRFHHELGTLTERVLGVSQSHEGRGMIDALHYDAPIVASYRARAAIVHLPAAPPAALEALERLVRITLPAFVRHDEDDLDVACVETSAGPRLLFIDRHPGGVGFARAVSSDVLRHVLFWSREIVFRCGACAASDGCDACVHGSPRLTPAASRGTSRTGVLELLRGLLGGQD